MGAIFSPAKPQLPPLPPPPPPPDDDARRREEEERLARLRRRGRGETILTQPDLGIVAVPARKKLLGE